MSKEQPISLLFNLTLPHHHACRKKRRSTYLNDLPQSDAFYRGHFYQRRRSHTDQ